MKNEIEKLNLLYGVSVLHILNKYREFKHLKLEKQGKIAITIDEWLQWLETQNGVTAFNIIIVGTQLLENSDIRKYLSKNNIDELNALSIEILHTLDFAVINNNLKKDQNFGIEYLTTMNFIKNQPILEKIDEHLYFYNLIYKDLIKLLVQNYDFKNKLNNINNTNFCRHFLNVLNFMYYHLDNLLNSNRHDLYYCSLYCISSMQYVLFTNRISTSYKATEVYEEAKNYICRCIYNALYKINKLYYIEITSFNYNNSKKTFTYYNSDIEINLYQFIFSKLKISQKIFLFQIADMKKNDIFTEQDIFKIEDIINSLRKSENIKVYPQKINFEKKNLIMKAITFAHKYCKDNNFKIENLIYNPDFDDISTITFFVFEIFYKNYTYRFSLKKINNNFFWKVDLKNKNYYRIKLFLYDDFNHLIQAMIND